MEEYKDKLVYLINLKKKRKDPGKLEKTEFADAWNMLVKKEGFSESAEDFLYNGIVYCGARPFKAYMAEKENSLDALAELYGGKLYGCKCTSTTTILVHLLSLSLNEMKMDLSVIISLMQHIPSAFKNKEGKLYGQADRVLKKYFFDALDLNVELPELKVLIDQGLESSSLKAFIETVDAVVNKMNFLGFSQDCKSNIQKVDKWLHSGEELTRQKSAEQWEEKDNSVVTDTDIQNKEEHNFVIDHIQDESEKQLLDIEISKEQQASHALEELVEIKKRLNVENRLRVQAETNADTYRKKSEELEEIVKAYKDESAARNTKIKELLSENEMLRSKLEPLEEREKNLEEEIKQRSEMIEMLRRDRTKQSDENLRRLSSKLKMYYLDYQDAEKLEMSVELGENMRDQLGEVLKIISSIEGTDR